MPNQPTRELNDTEKGVALTTSPAVHYLLRRIDDLKHTNLYSQKLKQVGNSFEKELEKHADSKVWKGEVEGADINVAAMQMDQLADMLHNFMILFFTMSEIPESDQNIFWIEINKCAKRFGIPVKMNHQGVLSYSEEN